MTIDEHTLSSNRRIELLDELRGLCVFCMVFYHAFYIAGSFFGYVFFDRLFQFFMPFEPFFASLFIAISGISSRLSHSNLKRGLLLALVAVSLSVVTIFILPRFGLDGAQIKFGILHFLASSILIFALISPLLDKINPVLGTSAFLVLFAILFTLPDGYISLLFREIRLPSSLYSTQYLFPLGFANSAFYSADYFPLIPNLFMFIAGSFIGRFIQSNSLPEIAYKKHIGFFGFLGKRALIIYILHSPAVYAVFLIADKIIERF